MRKQGTNTLIWIAVLLISAATASFLAGVYLSSLRLQYVHFEFIGPGQEARDTMDSGEMKNKFSRTMQCVFGIVRSVGPNVHE